MTPLRVAAWCRAAALVLGLVAGWPALGAAQRADTVHAAATLVPERPALDTLAPLGPRLPLATVIARTLEHSPTMDSAQGLVRTSRSAQRVALGAYLPSISAAALAGRSNQTVAGAITGTTGTVGTLGAGLSGTLDLFTGGRRTAFRHETAALTRAADAGLILQRFGIRLVAKVGYFGVLRGHELVRVGDEAVTVAERNLSFALARAAAGTVTPADVLQARVALSTARQQQLAARDTLATGAAALGRLVGADGFVDAEPMAELNPTPLALNDTGVVAVAVSDAPAVHQADALVSATRATVRAAKAQYFPTISAGAAYDWSNNGRVTGGLRQGWIVTVGATVPLFNGFVREDSVTRADVAADEATSTAADTRRFSRSQAVQFLGNLHVAEQDIVQTTESVRFATENLKLISTRYRGGVATILDLLNAQQLLIQAELALVSAQYTYQVSRATLEALLGREL